MKGKGRGKSKDNGKGKGKEDTTTEDGQFRIDYLRLYDGGDETMGDENKLKPVCAYCENRFCLKPLFDQTGF